MKFKENFKRFFTMDRHHDAGFTLVELIVVIAILAILAGVAVPIYSGYIAKAEKAGDYQLLGAVNQAFASAAVENGKAPTDLQGTQLQVEDGLIVDMTVVDASASGVSMADETEDPIFTSFKLYYGDNITVAFKTFEDGVMVYRNGEFKLPGDENNSLRDTLAAIGKNNAAALKSFLNSALGKMSTGDITNQIDGTTDYVFALASDPSAAGGKVREFLGNYAEEMAAAMGCTNLDDETDPNTIAFMDWYVGALDQLEKQGVDPEYAEYHLLSNYAVMAAASKTNTDTATIQSTLSDLAQGMTSTDLKLMLQSDVGAEQGLAKAGMIYGMYTAWANGLSDDYVDANGNTKADLVANTTDMNSFMDDMGNESFLAYLTEGSTNADSKAAADLKGYLGAMQIINEGVNSGDTASVSNLLINGYGSADMQNALANLMK